jgi:hypothetical protein
MKRKTNDMNFHLIHLFTYLVRIEDANKSINRLVVLYLFSHAVPHVHIDMHDQDKRLLTLASSGDDIDIFRNCLVSFELIKMKRRVIFRSRKKKL